MNRKRFVPLIVGFAVAPWLLLARGRDQRHEPPAVAATGAVRSPARHYTLSPPAFSFTPKLAAVHDGLAEFKLPPTVSRNLANISLPLQFEPNVGQADPQAQFIARGKGMAVLLRRDGISLVVGTHESLGIHFGLSNHLNARRKGAQGEESREVVWRGQQPLRGISNYLIGSDRSRWRTGVQHFAAAQATEIVPGVNALVYGNSDGLEYDLQVGAGVDPSKLRLRFSGAPNVRLIDGDLVLRISTQEVRMRNPLVYQEVAQPAAPTRHRHRRSSQSTQSKKRRRKKHASHTNRKPVKVAYVLDPDGSIGFHLGPHDTNVALVIDPSISVTYSTFLGGQGADTPAGIAVDSSGRVYVGGTTTSCITFPENGSRIGPADGPSEFFVAKIDPTVSGPNSLIYLTFLGGSGNQNGGQIAVDTKGDVAITGTTTSADFPVTDSSQPTTGLTSGLGNDVIVSELSASGNALVFSTLFGGSGIESVDGTGGIALDSAGDVYIASDTGTTSVNPTSPDLPVTSGAFQPVWDGQQHDGFLAIFAPPAQTGGTATLKYCSYLGTNSVGPPAVGGIAVDQSGNAYITGFANSIGAFPLKNGLQNTYGGGDSDAFLMEIAPLGGGAQDMVYATFLGGSGTDQALGVAVDSGVPASAYITGATQSSDFPATTGSCRTANHTSPQSSGSNGFLSVVAQNSSGQTSLLYSTCFGGSLSATGQGVAVSAPNVVYVAGGTTSYDFPWKDNLQPFNGVGDAFVEKFDTTTQGEASLIYATPLGGTSPAGGSAASSAVAIAADGNGHAYVTGVTTSADFPTAVTTQSAIKGLQPICSSCTPLNASSDAFVAKIAESSTQEPSVTFTLPHVVLNSESGTPQFVGVLNRGEAALSISDISIVGPNAADFSLSDSSSCIATAIQPGLTAQCSFEVSFAPTQVGPEVAAISVTDNAPGSPQLLELSGVGGAGPVAAVYPPVANFGSQPENTTSSLLSVTLSNIGGQSLTLASFVMTGANVAQFEITHPAGAGCVAGMNLSAQASCVVTIAFAPKAQGSFQAQLTFTDNSGGAAGVTQVVPVTGLGTAPAPLANASPGSLVFGTETLGSASAPQPVTLTNLGSTSLTIAGIAFTGTNPADFVIASGSTTCPVSGGTLGTGLSCTIGVRFAPQTAGSKTASLSFTDNSGNVAGSLQQVSFSGIALPPPNLAASPNSLVFAAQGEGTPPSAAQLVTISNNGTNAAGIGAVKVTDSIDANEFQLGTTTPCASIAPGKTCSISVTFDPSLGPAPGPRAATLNIGGVNPSTVALSGTATQASISLPSSVNFGTQAVDSSGAAQPITITNNSSGPYAGTLVVQSVAEGGTNAPDFVVKADSCTVPAGIPPGATCTLQIALAPVCSVTASRAATLTLRDNAPGNPHSIQLSGTASGFCLRAQNGHGTTETVTSGQTAQFALELDSPGVSGTATLACSNPPPLGTCATGTSGSASSTVQINSGSASTFQVSVTTTAPGATTSSALRRPSALSPKLAVALLLIVALCMLGTDSPRRATVVRLLQSFALLLLFAAALAACVGGGGSGAAASASDPSPGTAAGSYTLDVTATLGSASPQTLPITLIVQSP